MSSLYKQLMRLLPKIKLGGPYSLWPTYKSSGVDGIYLVLLQRVVQTY